MIVVPVVVDERNHGYEFERVFSQKLIGGLREGVKRILHESDLKKLYGWSAASVDFLIVTDEGVVPIQCKFRNSRRRENFGIENFVKSIDYIIERMGVPLLFGLWISRLEPFDDNKERLKQYGVRTACVFGGMDELSDYAVDTLKRYLCGQSLGV